MTKQELFQKAQTIGKSYPFNYQLIGNHLEITYQHHKLAQLDLNGKVTYYDPIIMRTKFSREVEGQLRNFLTMFTLSMLRNQNNNH